MELLDLHQFEKVRGTLCLTLVLPRNIKISPIETEEDLKKVLTELLHGIEPGEYPFLTISLAPIAYGKVVKKRGPKPSSSGVS